MSSIHQVVCGSVLCIASMICAGVTHAEELQFDLNDDGFNEQIVYTANGIVDDNVPVGVSTLEIFRGDTGERLVVFYGDGPNDFGVPVILDDISGDGLPDLIIPRSSHEEVVLIESFWDYDICYEVVHISRGQVITSPDADVYDFGFEVLPLYDIDGDEIQDVQIGAHRIGTDGEVYTRVYIYSGLRMALRAWADSDLPSITLPKFAGDSSGDASVTVVDLDTTIENFGATSADRTMGDLNNNTIVDGSDLVEVLTNLDQNGYLQESDPNSPCEGNGTKYRSFLGSAGWSCVTTVPYSRYEVVTNYNEDGVASFEFVQWMGVAVLPPSLEYQNCLDELNDCSINNPAVVAAIQSASDACQGILPTVQCVECPGFEGGSSNDLVCFPTPHMEMFICLGAPGTVCDRLIHEYTHVRQACDAGFFTNSAMDCNSFLKVYDKQHHRLCREYEAFQNMGWPVDDICSQICNNYFGYYPWNFCAQIICIACCENFVATGTCCDSQARWICTDCLVTDSP